MLRKIRIGISVVLFALITFYFLDFANILPNSFSSVGTYTVCPCRAISQHRHTDCADCANPVVRTYLLLYHLSDGNMAGCYSTHFKVCGKEEKRYRYSPAKNILRWTVLE